MGLPGQTMRRNCLLGCKVNVRPLLGEGRIVLLLGIKEDVALVRVVLDVLVGVLPVPVGLGGVDG